MLAALRNVLGEGFRVFFLAAGIYALLAMAVWEFWLAAHATGRLMVLTPFAPAPHLWHAHEMIYGYAAAALAGFFLTAAPSWTGAPPARLAYLSIAAAAWAAGRLAVWFSGSLDPLLVAAVDLAFLPIIALKLAAQLVRRPKPANLMLLGILAVIWLGNLLVHLEWTEVIDDGAAPGLRVGLLGFAALIAVIGGRVAPAFTRNAMIRAGRETGLPRSHPLLEAAAIAAALATPILVALGAGDLAIGVVAIATGLAHAARLAGWRGAWTLGQPILWSLHLGFAMLAAGYLLLGLAYFGQFSEIAALHILGIGAVGGMTLAVMSRAALGHTGRPLIAPPSLAYAYAMVAAAAILRALAPQFGLAFYQVATLGAGALWLAAFALFLAAYWTPLTAPRPHRAPAA